MIRVFGRWALFARTIRCHQKRSTLRCRRFSWLVLRLCFLFAAFSSLPVRADFVLYYLQVDKDKFLPLILEGRARHQGRTVELRHRKYPPLYFSLRLATIYRAESTSRRLNPLMITAAREQDADRLLALGEEALRSGFLGALERCAQAVLDFDPTNERAKTILEVRAEIDRAVPQSKTLEDEFRHAVPVSGMKIVRGKHFILMHDIKATHRKRGQQSRVEERLELMEEVFASYFQFFALHGVRLDVPRERLKVVIFRNHEDFKEFARGTSPTSPSLGGFWNSEVNISFFYEYATHETIVEVRRATDRLKALADEAIRLRVPNRAEFIRIAKAAGVLVEIEQDTNDVQVLAHELTHQLAGTTGLFPRDRPIPRWVHEGLATYFGASRTGTWCGIGAVNEERLEAYREQTEDGNRAEIDHIIRDRQFMPASDAEVAYAQSWALTHFLMDRHFEKLMRFYRLLGTFPPSRIPHPEMVQAAFNTVFPDAERERLNFEWRVYMRRIKTDAERAIGEKIRFDLFEFRR